MKERTGKRETEPAWYRPPVSPLDGFGEPLLHKQRSAFFLRISDSDVCSRFYKHRQKLDLSNRGVEKAASAVP